MTQTEQIKRRGRPAKTDAPKAEPQKQMSKPLTHITSRPKAGPLVTVYIESEKDGTVIAKRDPIFENGQLIRSGLYWEGSKEHFERNFVEMTEAQKKEANQ